MVIQVTQKSFNDNYLYTEEISPNELNEYKEKIKQEIYFIYFNYIINSIIGYVYWVFVIKTL